MSVTVFSLCHSVENPGCRSPDGDITERAICSHVNDSAYKELIRKNHAPISVNNDFLVDRIRAINSMAGMITMLDCCIETHCNWVDNPSNHGFFSIAHAQSPFAISIAECIGKELEKVCPHENRGVCKVDEDLRWLGTPREFKGKRLGFIEDTAIPAIIVELGHLSNPKEASWLSRRENWEKLGDAIARGFLLWKVGTRGMD